MVGHPDVGAAVSDGIRESSIGLPADLGCGVIGIAWLSVTCSACLLDMLLMSSSRPPRDLFATRHIEQQVDR